MGLKNWGPWTLKFEAKKWVNDVIFWDSESIRIKSEEEGINNSFGEILSLGDLLGIHQELLNMNLAIGAHN